MTSPASPHEPKRPGAPTGGAQVTTTLDAATQPVADTSVYGDTVEALGSGSATGPRRPNVDDMVTATQNAGDVEETASFSCVQHQRQHQRGAPSASLADPAPGRLTSEHPGRYRRLDKLGEGGIGVVRCALDRHIGREVALKELRRDRSQSAQRELRFVDEARITGQLEHPGIIPVYELGRRADGTVYYTMRRVRGHTFADALRDKSLNDRLRLLPRLIDMCQALAYAHSRGVVHRDLKPANVMLGEFGETLVLDWGLAKVKKSIEDGAVAASATSIRRPDAAATLDGQIMGTPAYMPPEQARGDIAAIDARSDVYALGAILYELLTGSPPYVGPSGWAVAQMVLERDPKPPRACDARVPRELEAICLRAMAREPEDRYADARALVTDLEAFEAGGLVAAHSYRLGDLIWRWCRRNAVLLGMLCIVLAGSAGAWWVRGDTDRRTRAAAERARKTQVLAEVDRVLKRAHAPRTAGWYDAWAYKLISLKEPAVESRLIAALQDDNLNVLRLAARALGGMGSRRAVPALMAKLKPGAIQNQDAVIELIRALGVIGDPAAVEVIDAARRRYGQRNYVWQNTRVAVRMVPPAPIAASRQGDPNAWVDRGNMLANHGQMNEAVQHYERALQLDPRLTRALTNRGMARRRLGDVTSAIADHTAALEIDPNFSYALVNRAVANTHREDFRAAVADLTHVLSLPDQRLRTTSLRARALCYMYLGELRKAEHDLMAALRARPNNPWTLFSLGRMYWTAGDEDRALSFFDRGLKVDGKDPELRRWRAMVYRKRGKPGRALADLDAATAYDPGAVHLLAERGALLLQQGRDQAAEADFNRAVRDHPERAEAWAERGVLFHARRGDWAAALQDLDAAVQREHPHKRVSLAILRYFVSLRVPGRAVGAEDLPTNGQVPRVDRLVDVLRGKRTPADLVAEARSRRAWCELILVERRWREVTGHRPVVGRPRSPLARRPAPPSGLACGLLRAFGGLAWPSITASDPNVVELSGTATSDGPLGKSGSAQAVIELPGTPTSVDSLGKNGSAQTIVELPGIATNGKKARPSN